MLEAKTAKKQSTGTLDAKHNELNDKFRATINNDKSTFAKSMRALQVGLRLSAAAYKSCVICACSKEKIIVIFAERPAALQTAAVDKIVQGTETDPYHCTSICGDKNLTANAVKWADDNIQAETVIARKIELQQKKTATEWERMLHRIP